MTFSFALGSNNITSRHARRVRPAPRRASRPSLLSTIAQIGGRSPSSRRREQEENARALFEVPSRMVVLEDQEGTEDYCDVILPALPYKELERTPLKRQLPPSSSSSPSASDRIGGAVRSLRRKLSLSGSHH